MHKERNRIGRIACGGKIGYRRQDKFHLALEVFSVKKIRGGFAYNDFC